jgi:hypothetical protein
MAQRAGGPLVIIAERSSALLDSIAGLVGSSVYLTTTSDMSHQLAIAKRPDV